MAVVIAGLAYTAVVLAGITKGARRRAARVGRHRATKETPPATSTVEFYFAELRP